MREKVSYKIIEDEVYGVDNVQISISFPLNAYLLGTPQDRYSCIDSLLDIFNELDDRYYVEE